MSWRKTITSAPASGGWRDTISTTPEEVSTVESLLRGGAQGATLGFADEISGGVESFFTDKSYEQARNESRKAFDQASTANPVAYGAGNVAGAVGSALLVPGLSGAATVAGRAGQAALAGGLSGIGTSEAGDARGMAKDAAIGAGLGAGFSGVGDKVLAPALRKMGSVADDAAQAVVQKFPALQKKMAGGAQFFAGVDADAALRQAQRPMQTAAAEADGFAYKVGQQAVLETDDLGSRLGQNVSKAETQLLKDYGDLPFESGRILPDKIDEFLQANEPSPLGFGALSSDQYDELQKLSETLRNGTVTGEDLVKFRKYMDHVERLAGKYDQEGTSPYVNMLKQLRGTADGILDQTDPRFDAANTKFAQFKSDTGLLRGATNEGRAESMISNLYGANKGAQQEAASRLFPNALESAKDISSNKAFETATRPGGDNYFRRAALPVLSLGTSEVITSPTVWQKGLRSVGRLEQSLKSNPQAFGQYAQALSSAMQRGPQALAATHFLLSQRDQNYRKTIESMEGVK